MYGRGYVRQPVPVRQACKCTATLCVTHLYGNLTFVVLLPNVYGYSLITVVGMC